MILQLLLTAQAVTPLYFIFVYIQFVLLTPLIGKLLKSNFSWIGWLISPITIIVIRYIFYIKGISVGFPFPETICLAWFGYYYLGMAIGNEKVHYNLSHKTSIAIYVVALILSEAEGFVWFIYNNFDMATTQLRLTSLLTSTAACLVAYKYISDESIIVRDNWYNKLLILLGDISFGIYFSHMSVIIILSKIIGKSYLVFPIQFLATIILSAVFVLLGKKLLGKKYSWLLGL